MALKSEHHLAKGYDLVKELTIPVGISNKDMGVEGLEPENAEKLTIDVETVQGKEKLNLYVFHPAKAANSEKTPVIYFIHGGGYHFFNVSTDADRIQRVADGSNAIVVAPDYTVTLDPSYKYPMELEEVYAGLLYVEPGVPHAYEYLEWTSQAARFYELRDHATKRMLGMVEEQKPPFTEAEYGELLKYISSISGTK